jgi:hypothetical protein
MAAIPKISKSYSARRRAIRSSDRRRCQRWGSRHLRLPLQGPDGIEDTLRSLVAWDGCFRVDGADRRLHLGDDDAENRRRFAVLLLIFKLFMICDEGAHKKRMRHFPR